MDAYSVYGIQPEEMFLNKIVWSFGIGFLILSIISFLGFMAASLGIVLLLKADISYHEWSIAFHQYIGSFPFYEGWRWFVLKTIAAGTLTGFASYFIGSNSKKNSQEITKGITTCVMLNIVIVLVVFFIILMLERNF